MLDEPLRDASTPPASPRGSAVSDDAFGVSSLNPAAVLLGLLGLLAVGHPRRADCGCCHVAVASLNSVQLIKLRRDRPKAGVAVSHRRERAGGSARAEASASGGELMRHPSRGLSLAAAPWLAVLAVLAAGCASSRRDRAATWTTSTVEPIISARRSTSPRNSSRSTGCTPWSPICSNTPRWTMVPTG